MNRKRKTFTGLVKFAVIVYSRLVVVFAHCEYEAVGIAAEDLNLNDHYPLCLDGYVFACHLDGDTYEDGDTYSGYKHPDDFAQPCSAFDYDDVI